MSITLTTSATILTIYHGAPGSDGVVTLTTTGSGAASLVGGVLNIPTPTPANLSLVIGTNTQAWSANLDTFATYTPATLPVSTATQTALNLKANLAGGNTFTGTQSMDAIQFTDPVAMNTATLRVEDGSILTTSTAYLPSGTGTLLLANGNGSSLTGLTGTQVANTPAGGIAATTVQAAINELDGEKAPLASPTFTGIATVENLQLGTNGIYGDSEGVLNNPSLGVWDLHNAKLSNLANGTASGDAINLGQADASYQPLENQRLSTTDSPTFEGGTFTGAVSGITKSMVGLGNVDNTNDVNKPVSTAQALAIVTAQGQDIKAILSNWFKGPLSGKKIAIAGDSVMLQASTSKLAYYGAAIYRPLKTGAEVTRSGTTVTCASGIFQNNDVGGTIYFDSGGSSVITALTDGSHVTVADSGTIASTTGHILINGSFNSNEDGPLKGVTIYHCGDNGQTLAGHISGSGLYPLSYVLGLGCDLNLWSYGINDVRGGSTDQVALSALLDTLVTTANAALPNSNIVLRIPNPILAVNDGYVTPYTSAQTYSDAMAGAYRAKIGKWSNVYVDDTRIDVWGGDTSASTVVAWMNDSLHPYLFAQYGLSDRIAKKFGVPNPIYSKIIGDCEAANFMSTSWSLYPAILEDTRIFDKITEGTQASYGSGFIQVSTSYVNLISPQNTLNQDIYLCDGAAPFLLTVNGTQSAGNLQVSMTSPVSLKLGNRVRIYRQKAMGDSNIQSYLAQPIIYPFVVPVQVVFANSGNVFITSLIPGDSRLNQISTSDTLIIQGVAPLALTGSTFGTQSSDGSGYVTINQGSAAMSGKFGYLFGAARDSRNTILAGRDGMFWQDANKRGKMKLGGVEYFVPTVQDSSVTTQFDKTSATLANITGLTANIVAGKRYRFRALLAVTADATGGYQVAIAGTATATSIVYYIKAINNGTGLFTITAKQTALAGASSAVGGTDVLVEIEGTIVCNAAGTLTVQAAQSSASGTTSVLVGSTFSVAQIP